MSPKNTNDNDTFYTVKGKKKNEGMTNTEI